MPNQQSVIGDDILSQADIILPSQYFATIGSKGMSGEQRLMLAVIVDAINVLQSWKGAGSPRKRRNFGEAVQWVNTRGTTHPFSFDSVCDALGIDSELLRLRLRVFTVEPADSRRRPAMAHLRLKELSRAQQVKANARRPSENSACGLAPIKNRRSRPFAHRAVNIETVQNCSR
jgi:hypothetical protein